MGLIERSLQMDRFKDTLYGNSIFEFQAAFENLTFLSYMEKKSLHKDLIGFLYDLSKDYDLNALRIGYCMTMIDTRVLGSDLRKRLGLTLDFNPINTFSKPFVRSPFRHTLDSHKAKAHGYNCSSSESHLRRRHNKIEFSEFYSKPLGKERPIVMYDSLLVETDGVYTGFSTNTVEFINGVSLTKGCFYVLKSNKTNNFLDENLIGDVDSGRENYINEDGILMVYPEETDLSISRMLHSMDSDLLDNLY